MNYLTSALKLNELNDKFNNKEIKKLFLKNNKADSEKNLIQKNINLNVLIDKGKYENRYKLSEILNTNVYDDINLKKIVEISQNFFNVDEFIPDSEHNENKIKNILRPNQIYHKSKLKSKILDSDILPDKYIYSTSFKNRNIVFK